MLKRCFASPARATKRVTPASSFLAGNSVWELATICCCIVPRPCSPSRETVRKCAQRARGDSREAAAAGLATVGLLCVCPTDSHGEQPLCHCEGFEGFEGFEGLQGFQGFQGLEALKAFVAFAVFDVSFVFHCVRCFCCFCCFSWF